MVCKLPEHYREVMAGIADCQKYNPTDSMGSSEPCVETMRRAMGRVAKRYLGRGNFRHAWSFREGGQDCVVKIANNELKRKHNTIEAEAWKTAPAELRKFLTPVTDVDPKGLWLVMPEANTNLPVRNRFLIGTMLEEQFMDKGYALPDQHEGNVGMLQGKPVSIDYGFGLERYTKRRGHIFRSGMQSKQEEEFQREVDMRAPKFTQWVVPQKGKKGKTAKELGFVVDEEGYLSTGPAPWDVDEDELDDKDFGGDILDQNRNKEEKEFRHYLFDFGPRRKK